MRRVERLQLIIEHLQEQRVVTADALAGHLKVSRRTIYRDIQSLCDQGIPIEGEAGVGYALAGHYRLPPLMFSREELEALWLGTRIVATWTDDKLGEAAQQAMERIRAVIPQHLNQQLEESALLVPTLPWQRRSAEPMRTVRQALDEKKRLRLTYTRRDSQTTTRVVRPLALSFWGGGWMLSAWCELRRDFRSFRLDRIEQFTLMQRFRDEPGRSLHDFYARMDVEHRKEAHPSGS